MHPDTEDDEDNETDGAFKRVQFLTEGDGVVDAMSQNGHRERFYRIRCVLSTEMITRIVITHQHAEGIVAGHREECSRDGYCLPVFHIVEHVEDVLKAGKAQAFLIPQYMPSRGSFQLFPHKETDICQGFLSMRQWIAKETFFLFYK